MPRKKSENLKVLQGTNRADRQKNNPKPKPLFPANPPRGMIPKTAIYARQFWKEYASKLEAMGVAREVDIPAFYALCMTFNMIRECEETINREGMIVEGARTGDRVKHPAISILNQARQQFRLQCKSFGLDPDARDKLNIPVDEKNESECEMEKLLSK